MHWKAGLSILAITVIVILVLVRTNNGGLVQPNIPPIPKDGVFTAYFDDLTISINNKTILSERFTNTSSPNLKVNDRGEISQTIYHSKGGSLALRQELDTYSKAGSATINETLNIEPYRIVNVTVWFMEPKANTAVYSGGFGTDLTFNMQGEAGYNASFIVDLDWNLLGSSAYGLWLDSRVNTYGPHGSDSRSMNRTVVNGLGAVYSFGDWHRLSILIDSGLAHIYVDGVVSGIIHVEGLSFKRFTSVEFAIWPHYYM